MASACTVPPGLGPRILETLLSQGLLPDSADILDVVRATLASKVLYCQTAPLRRGIEEAWEALTDYWAHLAAEEYREHEAKRAVMPWEGERYGSHSHVFGDPPSRWR